jgi:hypothetical protein
MILLREGRKQEKEKGRKERRKDRSMESTILNQIKARSQI